MKKVRLSPWEKSVFEACKRLNLQTFTFSQLKFRELDRITEEVSNGKTPDKSMARTLQELRRKKLIVFVDYLGTYTFHQKILDIENVKIYVKRCRSRGEKLVGKALKKLGVKFECEKTYPGMVYKSHLRFDFFFVKEGKEYAIEFDGLQHFQPIKQWGGEEAFHEIQKRDRIKNRFCRNNEITLLRIPYLKMPRIKSIVEKFLLKGMESIFFEK